MPPRTNPPATGSPQATPKTAQDGVKKRVKKERDLSGLSLDALTPRPVTDDVSRAVRPARARSKEQQAADKVVAEIYDKWVAAGSPTDWNKLPKGRFDVPPDQADNVQFLVRKAATHVGCRVRFGKTLRVGTTGNVAVVFAAMEKRESKNAAESDDDED